MVPGRESSERSERHLVSIVLVSALLTKLHAMRLTFLDTQLRRGHLLLLGLP